MLWIWKPLNNSCSNYHPIKSWKPSQITKYLLLLLSYCMRHSSSNAETKKNQVWFSTLHTQNFCTDNILLEEMSGSICGHFSVHAAETSKEHTERCCKLASYTNNPQSEATSRENSSWQSPCTSSSMDRSSHRGYTSSPCSKTRSCPFYYLQ